MGDLDDAIRDHLELKRRHGASEDELATKEGEARRQGALPSEPGAPPDELPHRSRTSRPHRSRTSPSPTKCFPRRRWRRISRLPELPGDTTEPSPDWSQADLPEDSEDSSEDVLEETPEFLEEMPEQDRLWFEQRPPKDFDFDD